MKKVGFVFLLGLVILAVLFSAGCINTIDDDISVLDIYITKDGGSTYCVGDTMTVNLPNYPDEGYSWYVTYSDGFNIQKKTVTPQELGLNDFYDSFTSFVFSPNKEGASSFALKFMEKGDESSAKYGYSDSMTVFNAGNHTTSTFTFNGNLTPKRGDQVSIFFQKDETNKDNLYKTNEKLMTNGLILKNTEVILPGTLYGGDYGATKWVVTSKDIGTYYFGANEYLPDGESNSLKFFLALNFNK